MDPPCEIPEWLDFVDHTADAGIVVQAADLKELFARAAWGMFSLITDMDAVRRAEMTRVSMPAALPFSYIFLRSAWLTSSAMCKS